MSQMWIRILIMQVCLKVDWCSYAAAKYACLNWHYSKSIPAGKIVKIGVWENDKYIGCVLFSHGANNNIAKPYNMTQQEVVELTRVALTNHISPTTQILAKSIKLLKTQSPGIKLIVSYADCDQDHKGIIYQANNWIYEGLYLENAKDCSMIIHGKRVHGRTIGARGWSRSLEWLQKHIDPNTTEYVTKGKHKYIYPMDKKTRKEVLKRQKPYPK